MCACPKGALSRAIAGDELPFGTERAEKIWKTGNFAYFSRSVPKPPSKTLPTRETRRRDQALAYIPLPSTCRRQAYPALPTVLRPGDSRCITSLNLTKT